MFEYHGWITVRASATADDEEEEGGLIEIVDGLRRRIEQAVDPYLLDLRWMNGEPFAHLGGNANHRSGAEDVIELFAHVGAVAPGSYGLLHIRDDEARGHENDMRVLRLVRGVVSEHTEPLLSPCIPTLEDPFMVRCAP